MPKFNLDNITDDDILNGKVLLIDKPLLWTSFDVVKYIRKSLIAKFKIKKIKVGHAGTLDPLASGLLIVCFGKETKNISKYQDLEKVYTGKLKLGESTPSYDRETEVDEIYEYKHIKKINVEDLANKFIGKNMQRPPIFSAIKKNGKRMYEYARDNKKIEIHERQIEIHKFLITDFKTPFVEFEIKCSKGTYIRSIAHDFGKRLNSGSHLHELRRIKIGNFSILNALEFE